MTRCSENIPSWNRPGELLRFSATCCCCRLTRQVLSFLIQNSVVIRSNFAFSGCGGGNGAGRLQFFIAIHYCFPLSSVRVRRWHACHTKGPCLLPHPNAKICLVVYCLCDLANVAAGLCIFCKPRFASTKIGKTHCFPKSW
jgi:uncharacterized membrane protein YhaH (DUF805 family)